MSPLRTTGGYSITRAIAACVGASQSADAWKFLARLADLDREAYRLAPIGFELDRLFTQTEQQPAAARFEFLKGWVLPADPKKRVRLVAIEGPADGFPNGLPVARCVVNTFGMLIDAAGQSGRLDELAEAIKPRVEAKAENAEILAITVDIARGHSQDTEPRVRQILGGLPTATKQTNTEDQADGDNEPVAHEEWADGLLALACMNDSKLKGLGEELADRLIAAPKKRKPAPALLAWLRSSVAALRVGRDAGVAHVVAASPGSPLWRADGPTRQDGFTEGWVRYESHLMLVPGSPPRALRLTVPLTGSFELTWQATDSGMIAYGGQSFGPVVLGSLDREHAPAGTVPKAAAKAKTDELVFRAYRLSVTQNRLRCWVSGRLMYESEVVGRASPFLALVPETGAELPVVFRDLRLSGTPESPRQVNLCAGTRLGWTASAARPLGRPAREARTSPLQGTLIRAASGRAMVSHGRSSGHLRPRRFPTPGHWRKKRSEGWRWLPRTAALVRAS